MAYEIPEVEPVEFFVGDTIEWTKDLTDFPASSYTLKYNFISSDGSGNNEIVTSTADGDTHSITIAKATSAAYTAGDYKWFSYVVDIADTKRYNISSGSVTIKPDPSSDTDSRSHVKKVLDAIKATIEGIATKEQQSYSIAGRSLSRYTPSELMELKDRYEALYQKELEKERIDNGQGTGRTVKVRFTNA